MFIYCIAKQVDGTAHMLCNQLIAKQYSTVCVAHTRAIKILRGLFSEVASATISAISKIHAKIFVS